MKATVSISAVLMLILALPASKAMELNATNGPTLSSPLPATLAGESHKPVRSSKPDANLSRCSAEIVQLTQAGMDESVVFSFISNSSLFQLSADHIVCLNNLGVPSRVIQAMLAHDRQKLADASQATNVARLQVEHELTTGTPEAMTALPHPAATNVAAVTQAPRVAAIAPNAPQAEGSTAELRAPAAEKLMRPNAVPARKKLLYPVREPYPVELTAPIVLLDAPTF